MEYSSEILEKVCSIRRSFDELVNRHSDDTAFADSVRSALDSSDFPSEKTIRSDYSKSAESERLLKIGIVGAVKAGKSSLLNSLFFEGQDILPKAATPMTAALTEITWGENCSVTVDFFTDDDVSELAKIAADYERRLAEIRFRKTQDMEANWRKIQERRNPKFDGEPSASERVKWEKLAESAAKIELKRNMHLSGAWELYQLISKSSVRRKTGSESFDVDSISSISGRLEKYVGADGEYMPFTSKVSITLPIESLRGISVVDTPGFNDPVASRDERARVALHECDAIFVLSRATPFLTKADMEVISKITQKDGIREIYIVPSQADSSLVAREIVRDSDGDMNAAISEIKQILSGVVRNNISQINGRGVIDARSVFDNSGTFNDLINDASGRMFLTSGICESMARTFAEREDWDSGKKTVWKNLCRFYPDFFSDSDEGTSIDSLEKLGNIRQIRDCIDEVKSRKEEIFRGRLEKFGRKYAIATKEARDIILGELEKREAEIKKNDIDQAEASIKQLQDSYDKIAPELDNIFEDTVRKWYDSVKDEYQNTLSESKNTVREAMKAQEGEKTHSWTTTEEASLWNLFGLFAKEIHHSETLTTVNVYELKNKIDDYIDTYNSFLPHFFNEQIRLLVRKVIESAKKVWDGMVIAPDDSAVEFRNRVKTVMSGINREYNLDYTGEHFSFGSTSTTLEGSVAEECISQSRDFVSGLNSKFQTMLTAAIDDVAGKCRSCQFSKSVLDPYISQLEKKKEDMSKPNLVLESFRRMKEEVKAIK